MGRCVNIPLPPETDDELFVHAFSSTVPLLLEAFRPDIVVTQLGVDTFRSDPLAHLNVTTNGFCQVVGMIKALAPKWVALGGGGYDIANVARAWTLAWALMTDREAPEDISQHFLAHHLDAGFRGTKLRDEPYIITGNRKEAIRQEVDRVIAVVRERALGTR